MKAREELKSILERLERKDPEAEGEAERFLGRHKSSEIVDMEAELAKEGMTHETMRHLCPSHRAATRGSRDTFRNTLGPDHPVAVLMDEHLRILARLDLLEELVRREQIDVADPDAPALLARVEDLADHLIGAEPHHQREEQVLFPELRKRGVHGPPAVMEAEHALMRALKHAVRDGAQAARVGMDAGRWTQIRTDARALVETLRQHIEKEDGVLFPLAVEVIGEPEHWRDMQVRCDEIGYCCGSDEHAQSCGGW